MRKIHTLTLIAVAAAALALVACSDDTEDNTKKDKGPVASDKGVDGGAPDQKVVTPDQKVATPDQKISADSAPATPTGITCTKDTDCYASAPICDPTNKVCVACVKTADCANSTSGGLCSKGQCTCAADTDCTGSRVWGGVCLTSSTGKMCGCKATTDCAKTSMGTTCNTTSGVCTCAAGTDCKTGTYTICSQSFSSTTTIKNCNQACKADTACVKEPGRVYCDTTAGGCVACNKGTDCASYKAQPWNLTCTSAKFCVECEKSADCTVKSLGNTCDTTNKWCVCKTASDCSNNENGKQCDTSSGACSCKADTDCLTGKKCTRTSPYLTGVKFCQ